MNDDSLKRHYQQMEPSRWKGRTRKIVWLDCGGPFCDLNRSEND